MYMDGDGWMVRSTVGVIGLVMSLMMVKESPPCTKLVHGGTGIQLIHTNISVRKCKCKVYTKSNIFIILFALLLVFYKHSDLD